MMVMNVFPDLAQLAGSRKQLSLPDAVGRGHAATAFQDYLHENTAGESVPVMNDLSPETIRSLALNLISALERSSMQTLFSEHSGASGRLPLQTFSTDSFLAMRSHTFKPAQDKLLSSQPADSNTSSSVILYHRPASDSIHTPVQSDNIKAASSKEQYAPMIRQAAQSYGLDPKLIEAVIHTESGFDAQAVSPVGAQGLMQLMPATAEELGVTDPFDAEQNIKAGSKYLKQLMNRYDGDTRLALAAYNWGMGNLERKSNQMPQETVSYVARVTGLMQHGLHTSSPQKLDRG